MQDRLCFSYMYVCVGEGEEKAHGFMDRSDVSG